MLKGRGDFGRVERTNGLQYVKEQFHFVSHYCKAKQIITAYPVHVYYDKFRRKSFFSGHKH